MEAEKVVTYISKDYPESVVITGYGCSNEYYALNYATYWAGNCGDIYKSAIARLIPEMLFFESWGNTIFSLNKDKDVIKLLKSGRKIVYQSRLPDSIEKLSDVLKKNYNFSDFKFLKKFTNNKGESVYEIEYGDSNTK
jgi:hypothetical protein